MALIAERRTTVAGVSQRLWFDPDSAGVIALADKSRRASGKAHAGN